MLERRGRQHGAGLPTSKLIAVAAPDGATWPCGHPKTPANTRTFETQGGRQRCRACNRIQMLKSAHAKRDLERRRAGAYVPQAAQQ